MGHVAFSSIVYVGTARLPRPAVAPVSALAVELAIDPASANILGVTTNLGLPSLDQLLWETLVGSNVSRSPEALLLEIEVRYCSPLTGAVCRALDSALRRAQQDARQADSCPVRHSPVALVAG
jgi:hypothetical protein